MSSPSAELKAMVISVKGTEMDFVCLEFYGELDRKRIRHLFTARWSNHEIVHMAKKSYKKISSEFFLTWKWTFFHR